MRTSARFLFVESVVSCVAFLLLDEGCSTRSRLDGLEPLNPGDKVWIWSGGQGVQWRQVIMTDDSVTGIPSYSPRHCDDCRRSMPRAQVDSIVVLRPSIFATLVGSAALIYVIVLLPRSH